MTISPVGRTACVILTLAVIGGFGAGAAPKPDAMGWLRVDYGELVDGRRLTHSGEPVSSVLARLGGRPEDTLAYRLLDPILESYAFVLPDALDAVAPPPDLPMVEVGSLWEVGEAQPAWVELVRARRFLVESDGEGRLRACLPASSLEAAGGEPSARDPVEMAKEAWDEAWPVMRHALAGERRRLAHRRRAAASPLDVEVHAYTHLMAQGAFLLGLPSWRTSVTDTGPRGDRPPFDLAGLKSLLDRGLRIEGARLESSGRVRWFSSEPETRPTILGRAPTLQDVAVAYRAVARGGSGEPYMSLDRASAPHVASVNYGGRLRDTALGLVSLLCDVRFKTFSVGIDPLGAGDVRDAVRRTLPGFKTHIERFASDPSAGVILNQQTRFWFYPDGVDLTLSTEGDVLAFRKVRMSAASERVQDAGQPQADPPWTKDTVAYLNAQYEALSTLFPEMADLDETVRLLSLFTWLEAARDRGLNVPDLDVLLALQLPAIPTPRRFPQLLSHDVLPPSGAGGIVDVLDRTDVGEALDRLEPVGGSPLPAGIRFARDLAMLNRQIPDQAALAKDMGSLPVTAGANEQDLLSYRAERLLMHARVLSTLGAAGRTRLDVRRGKEPATRVFSVGIGGVDLGMNAVLARATRGGGRLGLAASERKAPSAATPVGSGSEAPRGVVADPPGLPANEWPDHGLGPADERTVRLLPDDNGTIFARHRTGSSVRKGTWTVASGTPVLWDEVVLGKEGPEARARRRIGDPAGRGTMFERVEEGRFLSYRFERVGGTLRATLADGGLPRRAFGDEADPAAPPGAGPAGLMMMDLLPPAEATASGPSSTGVRLRGADGSERVATVPHALLQRLVLGRAVDPAPERPLALFTPATDVLRGARALMVLHARDEARAPWSGPAAARPGEEAAVRLAGALARWWSADSSTSAPAVVGVDPWVSPRRWAEAPLLDGTLAVQAPDDAFPAQAAGLRAALAGLPTAASGAKLILIVSAEPPGILGRRLRAFAADPASTGKTLAVAALGGPLRGDLPASLLGEGRLAALGLYEAGPLGLSRSVEEVVRWARVAGGDAAKGARVEGPAGPFTWFY